VLDLRILTPGGNFQKLYHDPFQTLAMFGGQPVSGSGLASACLNHSDRRYSGRRLQLAKISSNMKSELS
jgi:hypothetical protein